MPAGLELTLPLPAPALLTVSVKLCDCSAKLAVTVRAAFIVMVQVAPDVESHPLHAENVEPEAGTAVSVTVVPLV